MRAEIDETGGLIVIAESPLESFALKVWNDGLARVESVYTLRCVIGEEDHYKEAEPCIKKD